MSKVVAFVGSPKKNGNISSIIKEILRGAEENGAEVKLYHLNDMNIRGCQGCMFCREHESCCVKDDMMQIYEDVKNADAVVIGSPIYIHQVSAQTKLLLDRFYPLTDKRHKPRFGIKKVVTVYSQAAPLPIFFKKYINYNNKALKAMGLKVIDTIVATMAFTPDASSKNKRLMDRAFRIGKTLV